MATLVFGRARSAFSALTSPCSPSFMLLDYPIVDPRVLFLLPQLNVVMISIVHGLTSILEHASSSSHVCRRSSLATCTHRFQLCLSSLGFSLSTKHSQDVTPVRASDGDAMGDCWPLHRRHRPRKVLRVGVLPRSGPALPHHRGYTGDSGL